MKKAPTTQSAIIRKRQARTNSTLLPALVAVGGGLGAVPATALELGGLNVQSTLGQPLRASIAYALGPNEALAEYCISLRPGAGMDGLPVLRQANIRVADGVILLTGQQAVREPLLTVRLKVDCPYTPRLAREYTLFVDPPGRQSSDVLLAGAAARRGADVSAPAGAETAPQTVTRATARTPAARPAPVVEGTRYRVQLGDTLSQIAAGIEDRQVGLWAAVNTIFEANPDAFIDNDPNRLKAGSWLTIPSFAETGETVRFAAEAGAADTAPEPADSRAYDGAVQASANAAASPSESVSQVPDAGNQPAPAVQTAVQTAVADEPSRATMSADDTEVRFDALSGRVTPSANLADDSNEPMPGDVVLDENPYATAQSSAAAASRTDGSPALDWLWWLAGSGLALIGGLLMFGRGLRERFGAPPQDQVPAHPMRRSTDDPTRTVEVHAPADDGYAIGDDSPTEENLALDADLVAGTGLSDGIDVEVNEDFALAASTSLDFELPEDSNPDEPETDVISPPPERSRVESILESEILPEEDDYDMSVVMDATKMPDPADATERDFRAVEVDEASDDDKTDSYTINQEADYKILEQDYEDELTATQALNKEIERAAAELTAQLKNANQTADTMAEDEEATTEMQFANVTELDVTADVRAGNDDQNDEGNTAADATDDNTSDGNTSDDNTSIAARLTAEDKTVAMQAAAADKTVEIVSQDGDSTVEMEIESGRVNTKSGRG